MSFLLAEWIKIRSYRPFWMLTGLAAVIYIVSAWAVAKITSVRSELPIPAVLDFPDIWNTYSWIARWMLYFFGFAVIQLVCNEREFRTDRQNIIDGMSRLQYFFAKWSNALIPAFAATILIVTATFLFGTGDFSFNGSAIALSKFALCAMGYGAFALLLGLLFRRSAAAAFGYIAYPVAVEPLVGFFINQYSDKEVASYLPFAVFNDLIRSPFVEIQQQLGMSFISPQITLTLSITYLFLFWGLALAVILRRNF